MFTPSVTPGGREQEPTGWKISWKKRIKNERSEMVRELTEENRLSYMESMLGKQAACACGKGR